MKKAFLGLHARSFSHATEDLEKVKLAFSNATGLAKMKMSRTEGHHGNPIVVVEAETNETRVVADFFGRLGEKDLEEIVRTLDERTDEGCNLFLRIDKQSAHDGITRLAEGDDVISVRIRVGAFPSRPEIAKDIVRTYIAEVLAKRREPA